MALFALPSRLNPTTKRWACRTAFCAAALMACLEAGAASALSFNFSFSGSGLPNSPATVTGTVDGLVDNLNDQKTGLTVTVTSATNGPAPITFTDVDYVTGGGFDVAGGQIGDVDILYSDPSGLISLVLANYANPSFFTPMYNGGVSFDNSNSTASSSVLVFTPVSSGSASVPGPLPLLGAGAAFGWSRRLRLRIKATA